MTFRDQGIEPAQGFSGDGFVVRPLLPSDSVLDHDAVMVSRDFFYHWEGHVHLPRLRLMDRSDFTPAPNQRAIELYEIENEALDRAGLVLDAMRELAIAAPETRTMKDSGHGDASRRARSEWRRPTWSRNGAQ